MVGKVPDHWLAKSFPSLKPLGPYIKEVLHRCAFFQSWVDNGPPAVFWLPGFFFTQAFLTGVKQNFARKYTIPIDIIDFDFSFKDEEGDCLEAPGDGCYCYGVLLLLFIPSRMQGAAATSHRGDKMAPTAGLLTLQGIVGLLHRCCQRGKSS
jgi:hypothetical protein